MKTHKIALLLFLFLAIVPTAALAVQDFSITSTADFDIGLKSNSTGNFEIETSTDNPTIPAGQIELASKKGCDFTFEDNDSVNWKLKESKKQNTNKDFTRRIDNGVLFLNTTKKSKTVGVDITTDVTGDFLVETTILNWEHFDPYGADADAGDNAAAEPEADDQEIESIESGIGTNRIEGGIGTNSIESGIGTNNAKISEALEGDGKGKVSWGGRIIDIILRSIGIRSNPINIEYANTLRFTANNGYAFIMNDRETVKFELKRGSVEVKTSTTIYPNEISDGDNLTFKLVRANDDEWSGYYKVNAGAWTLIDTVAETGLDRDGYVSLLYTHPKKVNGPGVWFSHYKFNSVNFTEAEETYRASGTWISAEQIMPDEMKMKETTLLYSGVDYNTYLSLVEWINTSNNMVFANYSYDVVRETLLTITEGDLTGGTFDNVTGNFKIRLHFVGTGSTTPVVEEISGVYRPINTAPLVQVLLQNTTTTHSKNVSVLFKVTDSENSITDATLFFNGKQAGNKSSVQNNTETEFVSTQQSFGMHWFWIEASDGQLSGISDNYTLTIVNDAPAIYIKAANATTTSDTSPKIQFNITDPENETVSATLFFNGINVSGNSSVENNTLTEMSPENLSSGTYWFWVLANDGVVSSTSLNYTITINAVPEINMGTENETNISSRTFTTRFSIVDLDDEAISATLFMDNEIKSFNGSVQNNTQTSFSVENLSTGQHWFWLSVSDGKTTSAGFNYTLTVINYAPVVEIMLLNETVTNSTAPIIEFSVRDNEPGVLSATLFLEGVDVARNESVKNNTVVMLAIPESKNLSDGTYNYWINASDGEAWAVSRVYSIIINTTVEEAGDDSSGDEDNSGQDTSGGGSSGGGGGGFISRIFSQQEPETLENEFTENESIITDGSGSQPLIVVGDAESGTETEVGAEGSAPTGFVTFLTHPINLALILMFMAVVTIVFRYNIWEKLQALFKGIVSRLAGSGPGY